MVIRIYTDGACSGNPGAGGWGVIFNKHNNIIEVSGYDVNTTNNRMELTAAIEALKIILREHNLKNTYELYSDSAYVINTINNNWVSKWVLNGWKTTKGSEIKNKDLWCKYCKLNGKVISNNIDIKYIKIKGHSGDTFNEYVDKIAKREAMNAKREVSRYA